MSASELLSELLDPPEPTRSDPDKIPAVIARPVRRPLARPKKKQPKTQSQIEASGQKVSGLPSPLFGSRAQTRENPLTESPVSVMSLTQQDTSDKKPKEIANAASSETQAARKSSLLADLADEIELDVVADGTTAEGGSNKPEIEKATTSEALSELNSALADLTCKYSPDCLAAARGEDAEDCFNGGQPPTSGAKADIKKVSSAEALLELDLALLELNSAIGRAPPMATEEPAAVVNAPIEEAPAPRAEPAEEPAENPTDEPAEEPTDEPAEEPTDESAEEPTDEPEEKPADEPAEEPTDEPEEKPAEEPAEEPTDEPEEKPAKEPAEESAESSGNAVAEEREKRPSKASKSNFGNLPHVASFLVLALLLGCLLAVITAAVYPYVHKTEFKGRRSVPESGRRPSGQVAEAKTHRAAREEMRAQILAEMSADEVKSSASNSATNGEEL